MGIFDSLKEFADVLFNPILGPLLGLPPALTIFIVAAIISVISVVVQKYFTNQDRLKFLKKEMKKFQEKIKKNKDNQEEQLKIHKKMMPMQGEMMKESLRPTLWMMLPFMLVFFWLAANFAYEPIMPTEPFVIEAMVQDTSTVSIQTQEGITLLSPAEASVNEGLARWEMVADAGAYSLSFSARNTTVTKELLVTEEKRYANPLETYSGVISSVEIQNPKLKPLGSFTLFSWQPGWIAVYIFFSLVLSIALRKILDVA